MDNSMRLCESQLRTFVALSAYKNQRLIDIITGVLAYKLNGLYKPPQKEVMFF